MRSGEKKRPRALVQKMNQVGRAADVAANRTDCLAESADLNIDASMAVEMIHGTASVFSQDAGRVGVIDHHDAVIFFSEIAKGRQIRNIPVHREDAVRDQKFLAWPVFGFLQHALAIEI